MIIRADRGNRRRVRAVAAWITTVLAASGIAFLGFRLLMSLGEEDADLYESPLILSVARQLVAGPGELYGPFGGNNPLVLIHAPLYYRLAALGAWPLARAGLHPVDGARIAGRSLSALGLLATLAAAYSLSRMEGMSRRAGWWSMLLIAASPVLAGQPFAVRPDMVGVALQTAGVLLVLSAPGGWERCDSSRRRELHAVRSGGLREAAVRGGGGREHGHPTRGVAARQSLSGNDRAGSGRGRGDRIARLWCRVGGDGGDGSGTRRSWPRKA